MLTYDRPSEPYLGFVAAASGCLDEIIGKGRIFGASRSYSGPMICRKKSLSTQKVLRFNVHPRMEMLTPNLALGMMNGDALGTVEESIEAVRI